MRPIELRLGGVASYSVDTTVDFRDADLFAFVGPTGSGKSSLVDSIVFALYGVVPRHGQKALAPFMAVGAVDAAVSLTFTHDGGTYRVARKIRRPARGGVSSGGSRLEQLDGDTAAPLAADKGTTAAVQHLLGLDFDQFTRSVVLPQGKFADFLHAAPAARQQLIEQLMALDWIDTVRSQANRRGVRAGERLVSVERSIAEIGVADGDEIERLVTRRDLLEALAAEVVDTEPRRREIESAVAAAQARGSALHAERTELTAVTVPAGLDEIDRRRRAADEAVRDAGLAAEAAEAAEATAASQLASVDDVAMRRAIGVHEELAEACKELDRAVRLLDERRGELDTARRVEEDARSVLDLAIADADAAATRSRVAELLHGHEVGDPCPVCERPLDVMPVVEGRSEHDAAASRRGAAEAAFDAAVAAVASLQTRVHKGEQVVEDRRARVDRLADSAAAGPTEIAAKTALALHESVSRELVALRRDTKAKRDAERRSVQARERLRDEVDRARRDVDTFAGRIGRGHRVVDVDLVDAWRELLAAVAARLSEIDDELAKVDDGISRLRADAEQLVAEFAARAAELGLERADVDIVARAAERARRDHDEAVARNERLSQLEAEREQVAVEVAVSEELARHLRSDGFRRWLVAGTMDRLAERASAHLDDLTSGAFRLACGDAASSTFHVVDLAAGGTARSAHSLSGGETFLASLALALALSDEVAAGARGGKGLDTLLIDEGFGSLDGETLELVADALERLGDTGRMVGIVTHVTELAERLPVRFEIRRDGTSRVTRIDAHE